MATSKTKADSTEAAGSSENATALEKKPKSNIKYPPYVNAYGSIGKLFSEIQKASVPPKVTQDFVETVLGLKSSSHRALIPLLKRLGFIDAANIPTEAYRSYRDESVSKVIMAERIRDAYADVYRANEYAHTLNKDELTAKLRTLTGAAGDDPNIPAVVGSFMELRKLADFDSSNTVRSKPGDDEKDEQPAAAQRSTRGGAHALGLSYTINLNLPATTEIEVFNAIFRSLKEHLLDGQ
ncbi:hypothetical protein OI25_6116 [Paraburkholderia fungorum]|uniref:DUF5343 domain-containing protein n=1 Tax=Paraburkholderia fungorum TaxID=134537 RepID=A0AAU8TB10_9BURK|nr:DUF5343 domain-containing protein [Paraburkholderia fungorum]AJZ63132.1 hypothetical protein OI25_6116 [Paraburkholderia fungorum]